MASDVEDAATCTSVIQSSRSITERPSPSILSGNTGDISSIFKSCAGDTGDVFSGFGVCAGDT